MVTESLTISGDASVSTFIDDWAVDGNVIEKTIDETRTVDSLTLVWNVRKSDVESVLRPKFSDAGDIETVDRIDGGFNVVGRTASDNSVTLTSPTRRRATRPVETWYPSDYSEEPLGTDADVWEVEVEFVPEKEKAYDNSLGTLSSAPSETRSGQEWLFEFDFGDVSTRRVTTDVSRFPSKSVTEYEVDLILSEEEVRVIEESLSKTRSTNIREVPDGQNVAADETDSNRNTVDITVPSDAQVTLSDGTYVVSDWETSYNRAVYVLSLNVLPKGI